MSTETNSVEEETLEEKTDLENFAELWARISSFDIVAEALGFVLDVAIATAMANAAEAPTTESREHFLNVAAKGSLLNSIVRNQGVPKASILTGYLADEETAMSIVKARIAETIDEERETVEERAKEVLRKLQEKESNPH